MLFQPVETVLYIGREQAPWLSDCGAQLQPTIGRQRIQGWKSIGAEWFGKSLSLHVAVLNF
jgi:hypothetical protein